MNENSTQNIDDSMESQNPLDRFFYTVYPEYDSEKNEEYYVALCIDLDLHGTHETRDGAEERLEKVVATFLETADSAEIERRIKLYRVEDEDIPEDGNDKGRAAPSSS